jgi:hypothetical protein
MILRGLAGVSIGIAYGVLIYAVASHLTTIGLDPAHPGPLIPNEIEMARFVAVVAGLISGISGGLIGLVVGLSGARRAKAAWIGFIVGLLVLALLSIDSLSGPQIVNPSWRYWISLLVALIILPIGLSLMSVVVSTVSGKLKPYDI